MTEQRRVLSEAEIEVTEKLYDGWSREYLIDVVIPDLFSTIRDREKTIAEKDAEIKRLRRELEQREKMIAERSRMLDEMCKMVSAQADEIERLRQERDEYKRFVEQSKAGVFTYEESRERAKEVLTRTKRGRER